LLKRDLDRDFQSATGGVFSAYRSAVRWAWTEAPHGPEELCNFPGVPEMLEAARRLDA
jgi:hypothetical protein